MSDGEQTTGTLTYEELSAEPAWTDEQHLRYFLADRDALCPSCRRSLRSVTRSICPYCRTELQLDVRPGKFYMGPWVITLIALSPCVGLGLLFAAALLFEGWPRTPFGLIHVAIPLALVSVPIGLGNLAMRKRFMRLRVASQRVLAVLSILWAAGLFGLILAWMIERS